MSSAPKGIGWDTQPLGVIPDRELARRLGVHYSVVGRARAVRGIPPCDPRNVIRGIPPEPTSPETPDAMREAVLDYAVTAVREPAPRPPPAGILPQPAWLDRVLFVPDCHRPYHDRSAWSTMLQAARWFRPTTLVVLGDYIDCYQVSRFPKHPTRCLRYEDEIADARDGLDELDQLGAMRKVFCMGNHEYRHERYIATVAPQLFGVTPSISGLLGLEQRGWHVVGYNDGIQIGELYVTHDLGHSGKYALQNSFNESDRNVIIGHIHRIAMATNGSSLTGKMRQAWSFGWLGDVEQIDYRHRARARRDYQLGFGVAYVDPDGRAHVQAQPISRVQIDGRVVRAA